MSDRLKFDYTTLLCTTRGPLPEGWKWFSLECVNWGTPSSGTLVKGAVTAGVLSRGPRKGQDKWKGYDKTTERTFFYTDDEQKAFRKAWEVETGLCSECQGNGTRWTGWNRETGNKYVHCKYCDGTGRINP